MKIKSGFGSLSLFFGEIMIVSLVLFSCGNDDETAIFLEIGGITESVYASGQILAVDQ